MPKSFGFSYIVVEQQFDDPQGNPVVSVYPFSIKDAEYKPSLVLRSSAPAIVVKLYPGNRYPDFDYHEVVESRVRQDIEHNVDYDSTIAAQLKDKQWHLAP